MGRRVPPIPQPNFDDIRESEWRMDVDFIQEEGHKIRLPALAGYDWQHNLISLDVAICLTDGVGFIYEPGDSYGRVGRLHYDKSVNLWVDTDDGPKLETFRIIEDDFFQVPIIMGWPAISSRWPDPNWPLPTAPPANPLIAQEMNTVSGLRNTFCPQQSFTASLYGNESLTFDPALEEPSDGREAIHHWLTDPTYPFSQCKYNAHVSHDGTACR